MQGTSAGTATGWSVGALQPVALFSLLHRPNRPLKTLDSANRAIYTDYISAAYRQLCSDQETIMSKNNFQAWLDEADMPQQQDDIWVDLETGHKYDPSVDYSAAHAPRKPLSILALNARNIAKAMGGKALKGTAKQKEWAEKIRAEKLGMMTQDQAEMACDPCGLLTHSKFWIENRSANGTDIGNFVMNQKALLARHRTASKAGNGLVVAETANEYNALTAKWGF